MKGMKHSGGSITVPTSTDPGGRADAARFGKVAKGNPNATGKTNPAGPGGGDNHAKPGKMKH